MKRITIGIACWTVLTAAALAAETPKGTAPAVGVAAKAAESPAAKETRSEIPVTRVVLFSSGVGYFEHNGLVVDEAVATMSFKTAAINDVLKSMVVRDPDGTVTSINYASRDPLIRALQSFAIDISGDAAMADLLKQLRGAEVVILAPERLSGKIISVEKQPRSVVANGTTTIVTDTFINLSTEAGLKTIPVNTIQNISLVDQRLQSELNKALDLLITSRDTERKPVDIHFIGKGKRTVQVGYVAETPVWKSSYRLVLGDEEDKGKGKALLQGWAIVENTSDQDWNQVKLSLVSGRPVSFIEDLYTPLYMPRPVVVPERYASLRPQMYREGIMEQDKAVQLAEESQKRGREEREKAEAADRKAAAKPAAAPMPALAQVRAADSVAAFGAGGGGGGIDLYGGVASIATAASVGELFNFAIQNPIDLPRRRSAMLPIVNSPIAAERVSIYNLSVLPKNPLNGVYLTNDTRMKLLGGPVTVFDDNMYAGDAQLDNITQDEKRLLSYAIDLSVTVDASQKGENHITSVKIVQGVLTINRLYASAQTYTVHNKADVKRTLIIEHPLVAGRKLVEPKTYMEKTEALYRFRVPVDKGATGEFTVKEERTAPQVVALLDYPADQFAAFISDKEMPPKVKDALAKAVQLKNDLGRLQQELAQLEQQRQAIETGQGRIRENIKVVPADSQLAQRYVKQLSDEENQLEGLKKQIADKRIEVQKKQTELADYLKNLTVE